MLLSPCGQRLGHSMASRMPSQDAGACGAFQRNSPIGAAAYGMPRKIRADKPISVTVSPRTAPCWVCTTSVIASAALLVSLAVSLIAALAVDSLSTELLDSLLHAAKNAATINAAGIRRSNLEDMGFTCI